MKRLIALLISAALLFTVSACTSSDSKENPSTDAMETTKKIETTILETEETTEEIVTSLTENHDQAKELLTNMFTYDQIKPIVSFKDDKACVFITVNGLASDYSDAKNGDAGKMDSWDSYVASTLDLHNTARELLSSFGFEYSLQTAVYDEKSFPYLSITDGEIDFDFFHMGEQ